ncbi:MAG: flagellar biosynthetic protein FliQ [Zetaproteobacteria bacterium CG12_big_fil_rev_8_21_14_0_65_55_1124]|nr:MAG: EscS/YscS/HrcS family type III secretion system export apparatus protein [Zetaproteobacteria bacterium CG1_02_55_237]PIS18681.1 MAG: flagellar biosynthetic protein FliQ [Zetaproteobacteria bacterium CG08_land_8_20_14_0_20_55_17]PIW43285.1 MAG: flagellar biosynthetic protein FliQ [Zetaproteobacteria bacterium CG12_big_fil_rev_8_21_14_0_65_55_1124]PIY53416.1 MAG: flagellar biosynthetic protein FliQ [Zetaproteobacteria bacterium CG_4_10_14_0_8_um_filter_55_43]PIZ38681.1 MAG: flagellar bios
MDIDSVIHLGSQSLYMVLMLSLPMLVVALAVGVMISLFQAVTQIQEMTLTFVPKIIAVFLCLVFVAPWLTETMVDFTREIILSIPTITH